MRIKGNTAATAMAITLVSAGGAALHAPAALAAEGYRLHQPAFPLMGGEMASTTEHLGFFGTAATSYGNSYKVVGNDGHRISSPGQTISLPTSALTGGAIPDGTYNVAVEPADIDYSQHTLQMNLIVGYLFQTGIEGGRVALTLNQPYQRSSRDVSISPQAVAITPTPPASLPPALSNALNNIVNSVANQVSDSQQQQLDYQNRDANGFGDSLLAVVYAQNLLDNRLKLAGGVSVSVPDGEYKSDRGPNPGFNYYTTRLEALSTYSFGNQRGDVFSGLTIGGRVAYGWNSKNKDSDYKTGQFFNAEFAAEKVNGNFAFGINAYALIQTTDDSGAGAPTTPFRYRAYGAGPFIAFKLSQRNIGLNLNYADTFGARNAQVARAVSLRLIKTW
ncbi:SphA family protein [Solimonas marina]|uniref:MetA-pathway of phenol degradation n=1 Tax=Solimonas marina TaxID=2714601 RepID=A0A969WEZ0_9GAMM|nr:transporter [Solimonas marina]NKF23520.1 hypothetical protein [Solimonas marina]